MRGNRQTTPLPLTFINFTDISNKKPPRKDFAAMWCYAVVDVSCSYGATTGRTGEPTERSPSLQNTKPEWKLR